jgi:carbamoyltransferase
MHVLQKDKVTHDGNTFFGINYSIEKVVSAINKFEGQITFTKENNIVQKTAFALLNGETIGWFQSGCEFGPRALGRRSILADPRSQTIKQHINSNIKFREDFRPFAPSVLFEDKDIYFELGLESPYMILIDRIRPEWRERMPGVVHVDGTCRVQTVKNKNESFYHLLEEWKKISGISVLLNTSFNKKGMPIVETPEEAIDFFLLCNLDALVINDYFIKKI